MPEPITSVRHVGPATARAFAAIGITDAETLRGLGADAAYALLLAAGERPHFIAYYVLVLGLQDRPWNDCTPAEKAELRRRFDALKADIGRSAARPDAAAANELGRLRLEAALREIGVIERPLAQPTSSRPEKK